MYKHLLVAVDGSELSDKAFRHALSLAKAVGAKLTVLNVTQPWSTIAVGEVAVAFPPEDYEKSVREAADRLLSREAAAAKAAGIDCATAQASEAQPYKAILEAAKAAGADLIVMGSHGRRGLAGLLIGSVTHKTLTHGHIPVLVYRD